MPDQDKNFGGSIPALYDALLVPLLFAPYAADAVERLRSRRPGRILEVAAGTGVLTRAMAAGLPDAAIVATDLNPAMLERASAVGTPRPVEWRQADATTLPFKDGEFDAVVCQFGAMFFPDKPKAFAEARRVLKPGGLYLFSVWDRIEDNEFADVVTTSLAALFPNSPPRFLARTPHGYHDPETLRRDVSHGGFPRPPQIHTVSARSRAPSPQDVALAYCQGTPLRNELEERAPGRLDHCTSHAAAALQDRFGPGPLDGKIQAHVLTVEAPR